MAHRGSTEMTACTPRSIGDVLQEVPLLLSLLDSKTWSTLSSCSKQLRQLVQRSTSAICIDDEGDLEAVLSIEWLRLRLIVLESHPAPHQILWPADAHLRLHTVVHLSNENHDAAFLYVVPASQVHDLAHLARQATYAWNCCSFLQNSPWLSAKPQVQADGCVADGNTFLTAMPTQNLLELHLTGQPLSSKTIRQLTTGSWPAIQKLILTATKLNGDAMTCLVTHAWHRLQVRSP